MIHAFGDRQGQRLRISATRRQHSDARRRCHVSRIAASLDPTTAGQSRFAPWSCVVETQGLAILLTGWQQQHDGLHWVQGCQCIEDAELVP